jgi:hypothetical protein
MNEHRPFSLGGGNWSKCPKRELSANSPEAHGLVENQLCRSRDVSLARCFDRPAPLLGLGDLDLAPRSVSAIIMLDLSKLQARTGDHIGLL